MASNIPVEPSRNANVDAMDTGQSIVGVSFATVAAIQEADDAKLAAELNEVTRQRFTCKRARVLVSCSS